MLLPVIGLFNTKTCFPKHAWSQDGKICLVPVLVWIGTGNYVGFSFHYYFYVVASYSAQHSFLNLHYTCIEFLLHIPLHLTFHLSFSSMTHSCVLKGFLGLMLSISKLIFYRIQSVICCLYFIFKLCNHIWFYIFIF